MRTPQALHSAPSPGGIALTTWGRFPLLGALSGRLGLALGSCWHHGFCPRSIFRTRGRDAHSDSHLPPNPPCLCMSCHARDDPRPPRSATTSGTPQHPVTSTDIVPHTLGAASRLSPQASVYTQRPLRVRPSTPGETGVCIIPLWISSLFRCPLRNRARWTPPAARPRQR